MEHETFWGLMCNGPHWAFEIVGNIIFDGIIGGLALPFFKRHWTHHVIRDKREGMR